jgi:hypothetical protein
VLTPPVEHAIREALEHISGGKRLVEILSGNHDMDANGLSIIPAFQDDLTITVDWHNQGELGHRTFGVPDAPLFWAVPYGADLDELTVYAAEAFKDREMVWLMHHSFDGAKHGPHEFEPPGGLRDSDIPPNVRMVLSGHYHKRQKVGKRVQYVGAPLQHDFGEADYTPGFVMLTLKSGGKISQKFIRTPAEVAPQFHVLPHDIDLNNIPGLPADDFYRVDIPSDVDPTIIKPIKDALANVVVHTIPAVTSHRSRVEDYLSSKGESGAGVELGDVIEAYTVMSVEEPDRQERLVDLGKEIANEIESTE